MSDFLRIGRLLVGFVAVLGLAASCSASSSVTTTESTSPTVADGTSVDDNVLDDGPDGSVAADGDTADGPDSSVAADGDTADGPDSSVAADGDTDASAGEGSGEDQPSADSSGAAPTDDPQAVLQGVTEGPVVFENLAVPRIAITSGTGGQGSRPVLAWLPVDGAMTYEVSLRAPSGELYWAWSGEALSIPVGGEPLLEANSAGPAVIPGMSWYVVAIDGNGLIVGQSPIVLTAP